MAAANRPTEGEAAAALLPDRDRKILRFLSPLRARVLLDLPRADARAKDPAGHLVAGHGQSEQAAMALAELGLATHADPTPLVEWRQWRRTEAGDAFVTRHAGALAVRARGAS